MIKNGVLFFDTYPVVYIYMLSIAETARLLRLVRPVVGFKVNISDCLNSFHKLS